MQAGPQTAAQFPAGYAGVSLKNKTGRSMRPAVRGNLFHVTKKGPCSSWQN